MTLRHPSGANDQSADRSRRLRLLWERSPQWLAWRLLLPFGVDSTSERHESARDHPAQSGSSPVWVFGFPRTGTTTIQMTLAAALGYNVSFEPIGFNDSGYARFDELSAYFRGAPARDYQPLYRDVGAALVGGTGAEPGGRASELLRDFLAHLYATYGTNVVVKEVRLTPAIRTVMDSNDRVAGRTSYVGVIGDPLGALYAYYRIGGLGTLSGPGIGSVADLIAHRRLVYSASGAHEEVLRVRCRSRADDLLVACELDQAHLELVASEDRRLRLTNLDEAPTLAREFAGPRAAHGALPQVRRSRRYESDPGFARLVLSEVGEEVRALLLQRRSLDIEALLARAAGNRPSFRQRVTSLRHRIATGITPEDAA